METNNASMPLDPTQPTNSERLKPTYRSTGVEGNLVYESIFFKGKPAFLMYSTPQDRLTIEHELLIEGKATYPLKSEMFPYSPYAFDEEMLKATKEGNPDPRELYDLVYKEFDTFLDLDARFKTLETVATLETYIQHKLSTTSYLFHYGDNDSGKSRALDIHNYLDYRPLLSSSLPQADVYSYLGYREEGCGTILEDEAENLDRPRYGEKMKLYRQGYRKGATVPRIEFTRTGERIVRYFRAFCCKIFAGLWIPNDKGFSQRLIPVYMVKGIPKKDEIAEQDLKRFNEVRARLLAWRMRTYNDPLPEIHTELSGRIKELWKPKIQVASLFGVEGIIAQLADEARKEREEEVAASFEAFLSKAVMKSWLELGSQEIPFTILWENLKYVLGGDCLETPNAISNTPFGSISKTHVGLKLKGVCGGKPSRKKKERTYLFDIEVLPKLAKKYNITFPMLVEEHII
jgi:hypothetical protein